MFAKNSAGLLFHLLTKLPGPCYREHLPGCVCAQPGGGSARMLLSPFSIPSLPRLLSTPSPRRVRIGENGTTSFTGVHPDLETCWQNCRVPFTGFSGGARENEDRLKRKKIFPKARVRDLGEAYSEAVNFAGPWAASRRGRV